MNGLESEVFSKILFHLIKRLRLTKTYFEIKKKY